MNLITLKKIFFGPVWLARFHKINSLARKYRKTPELASQQVRLDKMIKYSKKMLKLLRIDVEIEGIENLPNTGGVILTPNHKSNIDSVVLMKLFELNKEKGDELHKMPTFVAKKELLKKRLIRNGLSLLDTFSIDRQNFRDSYKTLQDFGEYVKRSSTYGVIFPEGTRVPNSNEIGEFKAGAFKIAAMKYLPILPITIKNSEQAFDKKRKNRLTIKIIVHPLIKANAVITQDPVAVGKRIRDIVLSGLNNG
ncbi:1-acyl-sn-glycerol-3-phosphate acyltransferase [Mycoplasmopsis anatis]|uniref:1-acyl-sn-glycerol-3-phosphate acyltransferase n=1 Tax=Mycoplasmopsis anatis TaxID=171279 RepID=A0A9Q3L8W9_9BACT|nr:lysophospholipid acyltransferase family protein [Mycoplasmopsis anatis]MBW0595590.1 1-acyl-sn-glycerol-3-phosphate acyltransferase [Mycoplasmopsis anatis]MBW0602133.1 1-acyl-sn-glycerol-3-phosphate acyltransferase [Mycoplasmopsis anatis]MBW0602943.1 1-acyl-sn-glycerol-3-phosphate acyltransferase [Mycoplasmopsis anatis]MBW0603603.1 1-acyl-sn-glycerol-3-phosphate acyltransferase [Mycoplasmopsis anatis]MBW0604433.1 1-acyl-sn-glycerol-3-phosphate acyltransferase [Mycoplasmopsis anatis]